MVIDMNCFDGGDFQQQTTWLLSLPASRLQGVLCFFSHQCLSWCQRIVGAWGTHAVWGLGTVPWVTYRRNQRKKAPFRCIGFVFSKKNVGDLHSLPSSLSFQKSWRVVSVLDRKLREDKMHHFAGQVHAAQQWMQPRAASVGQVHSTSPTLLPMKWVPLLPLSVPSRIAYLPCCNAEYMLLWWIFVLLIIQYSA